MVKKTSFKRRGIHRGVQRHKIQANKVTDKVSSLVKLLHTVGMYSKHVYLATKFCTQYTRTVCTAFCIVPIQKSSRGQYKHLPLWKRNAHYVFAFLYLFFLIYKIYVTIRMVIIEGLTGATFICVCSMIASATGMSASLGTSWSTTEALGVLNSFEPVSRMNPLERNSDSSRTSICA